MGIRKKPLSEEQRSKGTKRKEKADPSLRLLEWPYRTEREAIHKERYQV